MIRLVSSWAAIATTIIGFPSLAFAQMASYYSDAYQGAPTASGELYDNQGFTAAHPSYSFGTKLKVTNQDNGLSVEVTVNDSCRCDIDLSKAAAAQIDLLLAGRAPVKIEVAPAEAIIAEPTALEPSSDYIHPQ